MKETEIKEITLIGLALESKTTNENGQSESDCGRLWQRFENGNYFDKIREKITDEIFAVYYNYEGDYTKPFSYFIGCSVPKDAEIPENMDTIKISVGSYLKFTAAGKMPAHVKKDVPGFIGNRLQHALWSEAISLVERGICDAETVDKVIKAAFGRRIAVLGPLENADLVGTDLTLAIHKTVLPDIDRRPGPSPYLERLVAEGKLGFKSGEGFRKWSPEQQAALRAKVLQHLKKARESDA